jgi:toxin ParE1/3/4
LKERTAPPKVHYTRVAETALREIAAYTLQEWGPRQRDRYLSLLEHACEVLVPTHAAVARPVPDRPELRSLRCERHVIYFRTTPDGFEFEIVHVLHERRLPRRHL